MTQKESVVMKLDNKASKGGVSFTGLLTVAFIVLKLCHVIEWSWWWVLSPVWIGAALVFVCAFIVAALDK
jgi:hypothetical protein